MENRISSVLLSRLISITGIFEKELMIFIYYALFNSIILGIESLSLQFVFFGIGIAGQIYFKLKKILPLWNNFFALFFFLLGSFLNYERNLFFSGFLIFIFFVSIISFVYDKWHRSITNNFLYMTLSFVYSAVVLAAFPSLYFIFMKNKLNIDLWEFLQDQEHLLVFSGYFVFYLLLLINKQLFVLQAILLKRKKEGVG